MTQAVMDDPFNLPDRFVLSRALLHPRREAAAIDGLLRPDKDLTHA
jgi:hypothetical protein